MNKIILSAFACDPTRGSEEGYGWNWAIGLANQGFEVHCLTREIGRSNIESAAHPKSLHFHYIKLPFGLEKFYSLSQSTMYLYYLTWQLFAFRKAKQLHRVLGFDVAHHVTWGSIQLGSYLFKLNIPFIFGPAGGGQFSPVAFKEYFGANWRVEEKRERVSCLLKAFNPGYQRMLQSATAVWVSNPDTFDLVKGIGTAKIFMTLDTALPTDFFPKNFIPKVKKPGKLNLLWVGRFMPRKGVMLLLDVMEKLRTYPGITLTMVGDGEERPRFLNSVNERLLQNSVFWKGKVPFKEVKRFYASHDVFFFTSLRDSGGIQLVEAMAYGMPVVTLNLHGQATIVNDETGFRCPCESPEEAIEALTEAIVRLYNNPELLKSMSSAAHQFALEQTWSQKIEMVVSKSYPISIKQMEAGVAQ